MKLCIVERPFKILWKSFKIICVTTYSCFFFFSFFTPNFTFHFFGKFSRMNVTFFNLFCSAFFSLFIFSFTLLYKCLHWPIFPRGSHVRRRSSVSLRIFAVIHGLFSRYGSVDAASENTLRSSWWMYSQEYLQHRWYRHWY